MYQREFGSTSLAAFFPLAFLLIAVTTPSSGSAGLTPPGDTIVSSSRGMAAVIGGLGWSQWVGGSIGRLEAWGLGSNRGRKGTPA